MGRKPAKRSCAFQRLAGRQAEMEKKSAEFREETRKAEETNRIMDGRESPGALPTIVSVVVAAVSTGVK